MSEAGGTSGTAAPFGGRFDLVIAGGRLFDPLEGTFRRADVGVADGLIAAIEDRIEPSRAEMYTDVQGAMVTPGLTDLHVHVYPGATYWGIDIDHGSLASGVTTVVDAGSAGAYNFEGLARIMRNSRLNTKAFLNIVPGGLATSYGELLAPGAVDVEAAVRVARATRTDHRLQAARLANPVGENAAECLAAVRRAADETGPEGHDPRERGAARPEDHARLLLASLARILQPLHRGILGPVRAAQQSLILISDRFPP